MIDQFRDWLTAELLRADHARIRFSDTRLSATRPAYWKGQRDALANALAALDFLVASQE